MPNPKIKIIRILSVIALVGAAVWFFSSRSPEIVKSLNFFSGSAEPSQDQQPVSVPVGDVSAVYTHPTYGFSFRYPEGFTVNSFSDESGETILVQKEGRVKEGFQIFISEFDEPGPITPERIHIDVPNMVVEEPQEVMIGGSGQGLGVRALVFFSHDPSLGRTREVWFVHGGYLYQVTARAEFDAELSKIMATFRFK